MEETKINEMETMNIPKLAIKISLPMIVSMISIALYGIVDTIFVANLSESALTAISLSYPIQNIITSIGLGTGIGLNSLLARSLGEKDENKIQKTIFNGITLTLVIWIFIALISILTLKPIFNFFTSDEEIISLGTSYLYVISIFSIGTLFQITIEKILEADGKTKESMLVQIIGSVINLVLDPILIYGFWRIPKLGIIGAGIATVIGQIVGMLIGIYYIKKYKLITKKISKDNLKLDKDIVINIYKVGIPTMILEFISSFILIWLNKILISFSDAAVSAWGIYTKIEKFVLITIYGLNYGMIPILAYNFGAKRNDRVVEGIKYFLKLSIIVTVLGTVLVLIFPLQILEMFDASIETIKVGIPAFRILSLGFAFAGISMIFSATFQAFGNATYSLIIKLLRKLFVLMPFVYIFKEIFGIDTIWWAFVVAEIITMFVSIILYKKTSKKILKVK